jgi:hypothetical protein
VVEWLAAVFSPAKPFRMTCWCSHSQTHNCLGVENTGVKVGNTLSEERMLSPGGGILFPERETLPREMAIVSHQGGTTVSGECIISPKGNNVTREGTLCQEGNKVSREEYCLQRGNTVFREGTFYRKVILFSGRESSLREGILSSGRV